MGEQAAEDGGAPIVPSDDERSPPIEATGENGPAWWVGGWVGWVDWGEVD